MIDLIVKRYPPPAWIVVQELGNQVGYGASRRADAVAISLWPSHGLAMHGIEAKASRSDLLRELRDPEKADAVGKYMDYWWLAVEDLRIIDGVEVPETWGVLFPKNGVLRVHRKAPKRQATPVNRGFSAGLIRKVCESWVPKHEHEELKKNAREVVRAELEQEAKYRTSVAESELRELRQAVERFEEGSGLCLTSKYSEEYQARPVGTWEIDKIADAVKIVMEAREASRKHFHQQDNAVALVERELQSVERAIEAHETAAANRRAAAEQLRALIERVRGPKQLALLDGREG